MLLNERDRGISTYLEVLESNMLTRSRRQAGVLVIVGTRLLGILAQRGAVVDLEDSVHHSIVAEVGLIAGVVAAGVSGLTNKDAIGRDATNGLEPSVAQGRLHHAAEHECTGKLVLGDHHDCERRGVAWGLLVVTGWEIVLVPRTEKEKRWVKVSLL